MIRKKNIDNIPMLSDNFFCPIEYLPIMQLNRCLIVEFEVFPYSDVIRNVARLFTTFCAWTSMARIRPSKTFQM